MRINPGHAAKHRRNSKDAAEETENAELKNLLMPLFLMGCFAVPVSQKRQIDVAEQKLPRDNFCLLLVSQLPSPRG